MNKKIFSIQSLKNILDLLIKAEIKNVEEALTIPNKFTKLATYALGVWIISYFLIYMVFYLISFTFYSEVNQGIIAKYQAQNITGLATTINTYPWNLVYIYAFFFIWLVLITGISYVLVKLLELEKIEFLRHLKVSILASVTAFFPMILLIPFHSIFATVEDKSVLTLSLSIAFWILILFLSFLNSTRVYTRLSIQFGLFGRRATIVWLFSYSLVFLFFFGMVKN